MYSNLHILSRTSFNFSVVEDRASSPEKDLLKLSKKDKITPIFQDNNYKKEAWVELINKIIKTNDKKNNGNNSSQICEKIKMAENQKELFNIFQLLSEEKSNQKVNTSICYEFITQKHCPWEIKKYLFKHLPFNKNLGFYHSYILEANERHDLENIQDTLKELKLLHEFTSATYRVFTLAFRKQGYFTGVEQMYLEAKAAGKLEESIYQNYLIALSKHADFTEIHALFEEAKAGEYARTSLYSSYIHIAGKHKMYNQAKMAFQYLKNTAQANVYTYNSFIDAASDYHELDDLKNTFDEALSANLFNRATFHNYIISSGKNRRFDESLRAFNECKKRKLDSANIYIAVMLAANFNKLFSKVIEFYNMARQLHPKVVKTIEFFIYIARENDAYQLGYNAFKEAVGLNLATLHTYAVFIKAAGKSRRFDHVNEAFTHVINQKFSEKNIYARYLFAVAHCGRFDECLKIFKEMKVLNFLDPVIISRYILIASQAGNFSEIEETYIYAKNKSLLNDLLICDFFESAAALRQFNFIKKILNETVEEGHATPLIYNAFLKSAVINEEFNEASVLFNQMVKQNIANITSYNIMLDIAGLTGDYQWAKDLLDTTKEKKWASDLTYSLYIKTSGLCKQLIEAKKAFKEAIGKGFRDISLYNNYIFATGHNDDLKAMQAAYKEAKSLKKTDISTYLIYIDLIKNHESFELIEAVLIDAVKAGFKNATIFNHYMNIAAQKSKYDALAKAFESVRHDIANHVSYTIFINATLKVGRIQEAKKALEEFKKFKVEDPEIYVNFLVAAEKAKASEEVKYAFLEIEKLGLACLEVDSTYISFFRKVIDRLLSFEHVESLNLEFIESELFNFYIQSLFRLGKKEEVNQALTEAKKLGSTSKFRQNIVQNWELKIATSQKSKLKIINALPESTNDPLQLLLNPNYRLLLRLKSRQTSPLKTQSNLSELPSKLSQKLSNEMNIIAKKTNASTSVDLLSLLKSVVNEARRAKVSIHYVRLTGGAVHTCLDASFYQECLERMAGRQNDPFLDPLHLILFNTLFLERSLKRVNDWDFKILLDSQDPQQVIKISDRLPNEMSKKTRQDLGAVKSIFFHKQFFINGEDNLYSLRRITDSENAAYEIAVGGIYARSNLFRSDALQISLDKVVLKNAKASNILVATEGTIEEAATDYFLKRLRATNPETINKQGCSTYITRRAQGYYGTDQALESHVCKTLVKLPVTELVKLLVQAKENHGDSPEIGLAMLFHICSALSEDNHFQKVEELSAAAELLWYTSSSMDPFYKTLIQLWIKEKRPFMEIRLALEMFGLLYLISSNKSETICKIDEHNEKQVIELAINGSCISVSLDPDNTFTAFLEGTHPNSLEALVDNFKPTTGFKYDANSEKIAKFLGLSETQLTYLKTKWMNTEEKKSITAQKKHRKKTKQKLNKEEDVHSNEKSIPGNGFMSYLWSWISTSTPS